MDQKELQEKIALYYSKLPQKVQEMFSSMGWLETLKTISQKYNLNDEQIETLGTETTLVLLGIIHLVEYEENITNELKLSVDSTDKMLMEIEESIIKTIRPQLVEAFEANKKGEIEQVPEIEQKLNGSFEKFPKGIEDIVKKSNYQAILYDIAKGYNLTVAQMDILEKAITDLIIGKTHPDEFENYLKSDLKVPSETVGKLVKDINEKIFLKIRELLKLMNTPRGNSPLEEYPSGGGGQTYPPHSDFGRSTPQEGNSDTKVLNTAGIEIIPQRLQQLELEAGKIPENREDILNKIEKPEAVHPILVEKLSGSVQTGVTKTEHSLENLTRPANEASLPIPQKPKVDPYREIPE
ncbi:hypothetical protein A2917_03110 [Candidatus Nomurabacteria bacterium RIFCSPLOWO2_01_FULL_42_17]|uniref:Uncharacterized protein n=1 Tax=Candidatus Nomurabacteria bacterium RIFCSPLOWO2_01_FULL_42_17 TaxID=1801780 RepID=A0A1F6XNE8_9BACT|nr:MAG: hypothetical protein A2917_03110 [Candidatus Nomurabacteria bacterium RIFCSPLOWO2_01_FULL_42_17]